MPEWSDLESPWTQELFEHLAHGQWSPWTVNTGAHGHRSSSSACWVRKSRFGELIYILIARPSELYLWWTQDISKHFPQWTQKVLEQWTLTLVAQWKIELSEHLAVSLDSLLRPGDFLLLKQKNIFQNTWNKKGFYGIETNEFVLKFEQSYLELSPCTLTEGCNIWPDGLQWPAPCP